jgi:hypothetical protein
LRIARIMATHAPPTFITSCARTIGSSTSRTSGATAAWP